MTSKRVNSSDEAFEVYNEYPFRNGFLWVMVSEGGKRVHRSCIQRSSAVANKVI